MRYLWCFLKEEKEAKNFQFTCGEKGGEYILHRSNRARWMTFLSHFFPLFHFSLSFLASVRRKMEEERRRTKTKEEARMNHECCNRQAEEETKFVMCPKFNFFPSSFCASISYSVHILLSFRCYPLSLSLSSSPSFFHSRRM